MNGQPKQGMGCCAMGCLTVLILGFFFTIVVIGGAWYFYKKTAGVLTSPGPVDIRIEAPSAAQSQSAGNALARLRRAVADRNETTVEFTGPELNALLARDPDFSALRDRARIEVADSRITLNVSTPLDFLPWSGVSDRWFNGVVRFTVAYDAGIFRVDLDSVEANGHEFPTTFLSSFNSRFSDSMNRSFQEALRKNSDGEEFWNRVKSISVQGDKVLVTTKAE